MARTTLPKAADKWEQRVKEAREMNKYCKGVAEFLGLSPEEVCASLPAKHYNTFDLETAKKHYMEELRRAFSR